MGMRLGRRLFAALAMCLIAATHTAAQTPGTVTGRATDAESGEGLASASVEVISASGRVVATGLTDQQGNFRIANVPAGTYSLVFMRIGYQTTRVADVRVIGGETTMAGAALASSAFVLNPVIITVSKKAEKALDAPASVSVVNEQEIAARPTVTPVDHLRNTPGVDIMTTGVQATNVVVRGFNNIFSGALHTLTDYRIAGVPSLRVNFLHFLPQTDDDISRIEVVLGPGSALYGPNTANGVLHFLTKSPLDEEGSTVSIAGGQHGKNAAPTGTGFIVGPTPGTGLFHVQARTSHKLSDRFGFKVSGQWLQGDEYLYRDESEDSTKRALPDAAVATSPLFPTGMSLADRQTRANRIANRDFDIKRWSGDVRADFRVTDNLLAVLSGGMTNDNSIELTGIGAGQAVDWKYSYVQARATFHNWFAQTYMNMSDAGETFLLRNGAPITDKSKVWASQLQHQLNLGTRQSFTYGADYIKTMPETEGTINGANEDNDEYNEFGAYIQSQTSLSRMFSVVLAGRYDKHSVLEDAVYSPRAGLVFKPTTDHTLRVTYNRAFSTPNSLNLFLDIDAGGLGALGPLGFRARAQAPGRAGINLHDAGGNLQIRTPFAGAPGDRTLRNVSPAAIYDYQVEAIRRVAGLPAAVVGYLLTLKAQPSFATLNLVLDDPLTKKEVVYSAGAVADVGGIQESTTSTFEVGYKGILGDRLLIAADAWWSNHKNFTSPLIAATPLVRMDSLKLRQFLTTFLTPVVGPAQAGAIARGMAQLPGGVVSSADTRGLQSDLIVTYRNFGDIDLSGFDLAATALLSDVWQLGVNGSLVSDDFFNLPLGARDSTVVALNAPKKKASANIRYNNLPRGINAEVRARWTDEFPANSAGYVGLKCVDSRLQGECVKSYTLLDASAGYRLPFPGASVQLALTNLLDEKYQSFIGVPIVRRMAILRLKYEF